jgi:hypothetical protein
VHILQNLTSAQLNSSINPEHRSQAANRASKNLEGVIGGLLTRAARQYNQILAMLNGTGADEGI